MPKLPSGKKQLNVAIRKDLVERFRQICYEEKRNQNNQLEIILEEWFAWRAKKTYQASRTKLSVIRDKGRK